MSVLRRYSHDSLVEKGMSTFIFTILIVLLFATGIFLYVQYNIELGKATGKRPPTSRPPARQPAGKKSISSKPQWAAVKVKTGLMCCKSVEKIRGKVFLTGEAPVFPLKDCKVKACECKYIHMNDRREGDDRRESTEFLNDLYDLHKKDRRKIKDRRAENL